MQSFPSLVGKANQSLQSQFSEVSFWWTPLRKYLQETVGFEDWRDAFDNVDDFRLYLSDFLFHPDGAQSRKNFRWSGDQDLVCGEPAPNIKVLDELRSVKLNLLPHMTSTKF